MSGLTQELLSSRVKPSCLATSGRYIFVSFSAKVKVQNES